ncbi:polynucleotide 5'-hydroxyl-kinase NOL9-like isoform X2 [Drosophila miranda]|uniref:polynucleotide 5'-hydroxyl-kinase NOL9-like isoform X2 n=1 Tax=Drosophila miranda TaxID=7229 RepID=UPI00143F151B|nr:polynucleotide 5'-hydroxyl-kinase NOL9-like isoform X2 [Drosophila miranda]
MVECTLRLSDSTSPKNGAFKIAQERSHRRRRQSEGSGADDDDYEYEDEGEDAIEPSTEVPAVTTHAHRHHHGVVDQELTKKLAVKQCNMWDTIEAESEGTAHASDILAPKKRSVSWITTTAGCLKKFKKSDVGIGVEPKTEVANKIWSELRYLQDEDSSESELDLEASHDTSSEAGPLGSNINSDDDQKTDFFLYTQSKTAWRVPMVLERTIKKFVYFPKNKNAQSTNRLFVTGSIQKIVIFYNDEKSATIEELTDGHDCGIKTQESTIQSINDKEAGIEPDKEYKIPIDDKDGLDLASPFAINEAPLEDQQDAETKALSSSEAEPQLFKEDLGSCTLKDEKICDIKVLPEAQQDSDAESLITIEEVKEDLSPTETEPHASPETGAVTEDDESAMEVDEANRSMQHCQDFNVELPYCPPALSVFENSLTCNDVLAVIKEDIELYGTAVLTLLAGQITVNGFRAKKRQNLTIYSPKGINWVSISPKKRAKPMQEKVEWDKLSENFTCAQLDNLQGCFNSQEDALVLLQRNTKDQNMLETLKQYMSQILFPQVNGANVPHSQSEMLLNCYIQSSDRKRTLQVPYEWTKLKIQKTSRLMVTGGKGVGKSTLLRYLLNRHLNAFPRLLFIDLDIGQPEIFLQQTVSCTVIEEPLLGPGFLLNKQPDRAHVVGDTNIVMYHEQYFEAVVQLMSHIQNNPEYANMPFLINTMGYNRGFGLELMALLVDYIKPTDVVQISSTLPMNNFKSLLDWSTLSKVKGPYVYKNTAFMVEGKNHKYTLHELPSVVPPRQQGVWRMSPRDMRFANLLVRLSSCLRGSARHLTDCEPLSSSFVNIQVVHSTEEDLDKSSIIAGMEANVVYLAHLEAQDLPVCLGIGVVRAIDFEKEKLYLVPAIPLERMCQVNCLISCGDISLPQKFFTEPGPQVGSNMPFVFQQDDAGWLTKSINQFYSRTSSMKKD